MKKLFFATLFAISAFVGHSQVKIAHVDVQKVIDTLPSYKEAKKSMQDLMLAAEKDLKELESKYEKSMLEYEEAAANPNASQITLERLKRAVQTAQRRLVEAEELWQADAQKLNERLNKPILDRAQKAIDNVGDKMKLLYVLDLNATHYAKGEDITNTVIVEALALDKEALAKAKATPAGN
jgi:outer membrane protein